jgi:hypothetical protein
MKAFRIKSVIAVLVALLGFMAQAPAQSLAIDWYTIDGGGGASAGGSFSLTGSVGQPDAGAMAGGAFSLQGGFWAIVAVQQPGAPLLTIRNTATNTVIVSWPSTPIGFVPQQTANLNSAGWAPAPESIVDDGTNKFIILPAPAGTRFYRLTRP